MINLFQITANDASMSYLATIFGNVNGVISIAGQSLGDSITLLGTMFKTFNSIVLVVAIVVLVYVTVVGVLATAYEGEFLGKKWNNIWVPLRLVIGFALLVPTGSGYCGIQILIMWVIVQGIGAADTLWNTALSYVTLMGSPYAKANVPNVDVTQKLNLLFQGLVCDATSRKSYDNPIDKTSPDGGYYCAGSSSSFCGGKPEINTSTSVNTLPLGPTGRCGVLTYCDQSTQGDCKDPNSLTCLSCQAQVRALTQIVPVLYGIAQQMVNADYSYRQFYYNSASSTNNSGWQWIYSYCGAQTDVIQKPQCCIKRNVSEPTCEGEPEESTPLPNVNYTPGGQKDIKNAGEKAVKDLYWAYWPQLGPTLGKDVDFIKTAVNFYTDQANQALTTYIASQGQNPNNLNSALQTASAQGWIFAGAYYYAMANMNGQQLKAALPQLLWKDDNFPTDVYRNNFLSASFLTTAASGNAAAAASAMINKMPELNNASQAISAAASTILDSFQDNLTAGGQGSPNPLISLQRLGSILMIVAQTLFVVFFVVILTAGILGGLNIFVLGTGVTNPFGLAANIAAMVLMPLIYAALGIMIALGGLLAVYTPLIPYIVFAFGALGWLISTIEAMVAGPLVALQVLIPSEHQGPLGKAEGALMLLFNIFLRPSLMIFGMMGAMLLATVAVRMVNAGFGMVYNALIGTTAVPGSFDPISFFMMMGAYVMFILAVLNKCFALINVVPQQVMRWIGGQGEEVGAPLQEVKGGVEGVGGRGSGAMTSGREKEVAKVGLEQREAKKGAPGGGVKKE